MTPEELRALADAAVKHGPTCIFYGPLRQAADRIAALESAIEPLAAWAAVYPTDVWDSELIVQGFSPIGRRVLTVGHARRAAELLSREQGNG